MASRREARVRRAATGEVPTVWSADAALPDAPEAAIAGTVAAPAPAPAPLEEKESDAASPAPVTRASRRIRTASTPLPEIAAVTEGDESGSSSSSVPTAAIAWAVAAAAAAAPQAPAVVEPVLTPAEPFELLEPAVEAIADTGEVADETEPQSEPEPEPETAEGQGAFFDVDEFEAAARLFSFTGETPVQEDPVAEAPVDSDEAAPSEPASPEPAHTPARRRVRNAGRQLATASFSVGVMGIVGLLTVGMTTPADAVAAVSGTEPTSLVAAEGAEPEVAAEDIQAYVAPGDIQNATLERDETYSTVSMGEIAAEQGITNYSNFFVNDPNAAIQWPFAVGVPITYGFGMRSGRMHEGADFVPGQGAEIQAIADGTVRIATNSGGAYGVTVVIDHIIDGQLVSSRYAHMLYGTLNVSAGQQVTVGTVLGQTGNTGRSYGAHTHFEILQGGTTAIDPIAWLRDHAGRYSLDSE